jgi:hypothetical protein
MTFLMFDPRQLYFNAGASMPISDMHLWWCAMAKFCSELVRDLVFQILGDADVPLLCSTQSVWSRPPRSLGNADSAMTLHFPLLAGVYLIFGAFLGDADDATVMFRS